jgi:hypothetical protein
MQLHQWIKALAHFYGLVGDARSVERNIEVAPLPVEALSGSGEAFIDPGQASLKGYLGSHLNDAGERVDVFFNASGRLCLITRHRDGTTSIDGQPNL